MNIYLGNLSVEQIEKRTGITLTDEHIAMIKIFSADMGKGERNEPIRFLRI